MDPGLPPVADFDGWVSEDAACSSRGLLVLVLLLPEVPPANSCTLLAEPVVGNPLAPPAIEDAAMGVLVGVETEEGEGVESLLLLLLLPSRGVGEGASKFLGLGLSTNFLLSSAALLRFFSISPSLLFCMLLATLIPHKKDEMLVATPKQRNNVVVEKNEEASSEDEEEVGTSTVTRRPIKRINVT